MGRAPCCDKAHVKKGPWSPEEDAKLKEYIEKHGTGGNWIAFPQKADLRRCGKSCRLRWLNYLRPNIKHGEFSDVEDRIICSLFASIGSRWSIIAAQLPGRTDNDIKNYWNTKLKKKLLGIAPSFQNQKRPLQATTYPSISLLQSSYSLPSSTAEYKCSNNSYFNTQASSSFTGYEPISIPSNLLNTSTCSSIASASALLQAPEGYVGPTLIGGEASCSSSDGSCNNQISHGREMLEHDYGVSNGGHMGFQSYFYNGVDNVNGYPEKANGFYGETPINYSSLEEFKQLISTNIFIDEEKVMY